VAVASGEEEDEADEACNESRVGVPAVRKKVLGGLGKLKDYSKRSKVLANPYAPTEVRETSNVSVKGCLGGVP